MITGARDTGAPMLVLYALTRRAAGEIATGRWTTARAGMAEALQLADGTGQPGLAAMPLIGHAPSTRPGIPRRPCTTSNSSCSHHRLAALDRLEAAARAGRPETAADWVRGARRVRRDDRIYADRRRRRPRPRPARHRPCGQQHFETALAHHARSPRRVDAARTHLAYGEHLRRARRRVDARTHLRAALAVFDDVGAEPWAERARQELRASGDTARRRDGSDAPTLTPQELQVATLVAQGLPNREVAWQLFVSPRTVDFHLRNVFTKLGISSRGELIRVTLR